MEMLKEEEEEKNPNGINSQMQSKKYEQKDGIR